MKRLLQLVRVTATVAVFVALPWSARGDVRKEGTWPSDKKVSLTFEGKPSEGLTKLAAEAGWSLVVSKDVDVDGHDVTINVDKQPADAVLGALFANANVIARRKGSLITVTQAERGSGEREPKAASAPAPIADDDDDDLLPPAPPTPPAPPAPPPPIAKGEDRTVFGGSVVVQKNDVVHTVTVTGGSARIDGTVTGDLVVAGGSAKIEEGARVMGNATVFGGSLKVERGARVDGDVGVVGGSLKREEGAIIGGKIDDPHEKKNRVKVSAEDGDAAAPVDEDETEAAPRRSGLGTFAYDFGQSTTKMSFLFVFGCVLLALATRKIDVLRVEIASRPMKSFAMGVVGLLASAVALLAMCITIVGIPVALLLSIVAVFSVYASICAVLTTFGALVTGHKTRNPYVHLAVGCFALLLVSVIPYVGEFAVFVLTMIAIGALVSTRLAGIAERPASKAELV